MTNFFRSGSFGYGTSVSGHSDVDYFAVFPTANLKQNSNVTLNAVATALRTRFPNTNVTVESPAIIVPFGNGKSEQHEIIPADHVATQSGFNIHDIPDRSGGWMQSSPAFYGAYVDAVNTKLDKKAKPLIRLLKAWKYYCSVPMRSFYLEMKATAYADTQSAIIYRYDLRDALNYLITSRLAPLADPLGLPTLIYAATTEEINTVWRQLQTAHSHILNALEKEANGDLQRAFWHWDKVFNGSFPGYY
jgi:hypothetical protein